MASYAQNSFLGGEWSPTMQGRFERPDYKAAMNVCLNGLPLDTGAWTRRPGSQYICQTWKAQPARVVSFAFKNSTPYVLEFTAGQLRFISQNTRATDNAPIAIASMSTANPAVLATSVAHGLSTGAEFFLGNLGTSCPSLHRRQLIGTVVDGTHISIADLKTGTGIDGSTVGTIAAGAVINHLIGFSTPYTGTTYSRVRSVQAETQSVLLEGSTPPQVLNATVAPSPTAFATFTFGAAQFSDGPYLSPVVGSLATPSAVNGVITVTLSFQAYDSTRSYNLGDFVSASGVNYQSIVQGNTNHTPASSGSYWAVVAGGAAVGPLGFVPSDVGRHIRLFSEPNLWAVGTAYTAGNTVTYNSAYYIAIGSSTGVIPGTDVTKWAPYSGAVAASWTWGKITAVSGAGLISPTLSGTVHVGNMTAGGGIAAAFDGNLSQTAAASAGGPSENVTPPAWVPGTIYNAGNVAIYSSTLYIASAPATAAWATTSAPSNGSVVTSGGRYWVVKAQPPVYVQGGG